MAYKGTVLGDIAFGHLLIDNRLIVFPVAIHSLQGIHLDDLKSWMRLCQVQIAILANFDAIHLQTLIVRA